MAVTARRGTVAGAILLWAATVCSGAASDHPAAPEVQALKFDGSGGGVNVQVRTSAPVSPFRCYTSASNPPEVVVEIPGAVNKLQSSYALDGHLVQSVRVEPASGADGVRIHFVLGQGALSGVEQTAQGLLIVFTRAHGASDPGRPDEEYHVGVGDKIDVSVYGHDDLTRTLDVRSDGTIAFPLIGDLNVAGRTTAEIDDAITKALGKDYLVDPEVEVDVKESQSRWVTILGEVRNPGKYLLKRSMHVIDLIAEAGGVTKDAGSGIVVTHRDAPGDDPRQIAIDRDRLFGSDDQTLNLALVPGDVVTIAEKEVFYIRGEVVKPGPYFIEKGMTVLKAITFAGGFSQFANRKDVVLLRSDGNRVQQKVNVNLKAIEEGKAPDIALAPNDLIIVPRRVF